jgi:hypothetical protein
MRHGRRAAGLPLPFGILLYGSADAEHFAGDALAGIAIEGVSRQFAVAHEPVHFVLGISFFDTVLGNYFIDQVIDRFESG